MLGYRKAAAVSAVVLPLLLAGCAATASDEVVREEAARGGADWILVEQGRATPTPESLFFSMPQMKPKATARNSNAIKPPPRGRCRDTPRAAPNTVGTIDRASSQ